MIENQTLTGNSDKSKHTCLMCGCQTTFIARDIFDTRFGIEKSYSIARCLQCDLEQLTPLPNATELKVLYERYYNFSGGQNNTYIKLRQKLLSSVLYKSWVAVDGDISFHLMKGSGRLLDIGCNEGRGLTLYRANGFQSEGLELNEVAAKAAMDKGFTVHTKLLEDFFPDKLYDVVVLSNVLEHSLNPKEMLSKVHQILNPDGKIWISCPNSQSILRNLFGYFWINWHVPFHIVQFSSKTVRNLLHETEFSNIKISQKTPAVWAAYSIISRLFSKPGFPTKQLQSTILVAWLTLIIRIFLFPFLYLANQSGVGDCIVVKAQKK
jgi:2-polyprenyl-3-methyl-5-hydroxy-6-metoxy-1,4-benzoquinol methylase